MISPTVGRVVWFWSGKTQEQPHAALVAYVYDDRTVNLAVFNAYGVPQSHARVRLLQDDDAPPELGVWAEWVPAPTPDPIAPHRDPPVLDA